MNFAVSIGLEIHIQLKTKTKLFSSALSLFGEKSNTNVSNLDIGFPGAMPIINKDAVIMAIKACNAFHLQIDHHLCFDRKNYFYSDLAKGYQLTQYYRPIGRNGYVELFNVDGNKKIRLRRLHLEEDTAKQKHDDKYTYIDYNRSGVPLIEIVTEPDFTNADEVVAFLKLLRLDLLYLDICDGKLEDGSIRVDINMSLSPYGDNKLGHKVEIKNLNSYADCRKAIEYEINQQNAILLSGQEVIEETRRYDEMKKQTLHMRDKDNHYRYIPETNLLPIQLSDSFIDEIILQMPLTPDDFYQKFSKYGLSNQQIFSLLENKQTSLYFDGLVESGINPKLAFSWVSQNIQSYLNEHNIEIDEFPISFSDMVLLLKTLEEGKITQVQAKEIFLQALTDKENIEVLLKNLNCDLIISDEILLDFIKQYLKENPGCINDYRKGKTRVIGFLVGKVIKSTKGSVNPQHIHDLVVQVLEGENYA